MDLVPFQLRTGQVRKESGHGPHLSVDPGPVLLGLKDGFHGKQAHAGYRSAAFGVFRVGNGLPQHLISSADADQGHSPGHQLLDCRFQAALAKPVQVGNGVFGAGQDHQVRLSQLFGLADIPDPYACRGFQHGKIRKIGQLGQADHRDVQQGQPGGAAETLGKAVLIVDVYIHHGYHPCHRLPGQLLQHLQAAVQQRNVTPELVNHGGLDHIPLLRIQQSHRSVELGKHPAPVNVSHQQYRCTGDLCHAHVDKIIFFQIDLCRASGAFDDDDVVFLRKGIKSGLYLRDQAFFHLIVFRCPVVSPDLSPYNDL